MLVKRRILVALAFADAGALLITRRTPASRRRPQLQARADADEAAEMRQIFESGADLLTPEEEMAKEDAREGVASVFDAEEARTEDAKDVAKVHIISPRPLRCGPSSPRDV